MPHPSGRHVVAFVRQALPDGELLDEEKRLYRLDQALIVPTPATERVAEVA